MKERPLRALCLPGSGCRGAFQFGVARRLYARGERFDVVAGASSGSICGAVWVAGLADQGPDMFRSLASTPIVSARYLKTERSPFGMGSIVREALSRYVPEALVAQSETELLVSTTRASRFLRSALEAASRRVRVGLGRAAPAPAPSAQHYEHPSPVHALATDSGSLVIHSNRTRSDMHDVIVASCTIPGLYAKLPVIDGEVHVDGGAADNTLLGELVARGFHDITIVTPFEGGAVSPTLFERERAPRLPAHVKLTVLSPARPIRLRHFDFDPERLDEALELPHREDVVERDLAPAREAGAS